MLVSNHTAPKTVFRTIAALTGRRVMLRVNGGEVTTVDHADPEPLIRAGQVVQLQAIGPDALRVRMVPMPGGGVRLALTPGAPAPAIEAEEQAYLGPMNNSPDGFGAIIATIEALGGSLDGLWAAPEAKYLSPWETGARLQDTFWRMANRYHESGFKVPLVGGESCSDAAATLMSAYCAGGGGRDGMLLSARFTMACGGTLFFGAHAHRSAPCLWLHVMPAHAMPATIGQREGSAVS